MLVVDQQVEEAAGNQCVKMPGIWKREHQILFVPVLPLGALEKLDGALQRVHIEHVQFSLVSDQSGGGKPSGNSARENPFRFSPPGALDGNDPEQGGLTGAAVIA